MYPMKEGEDFMQKKSRKKLSFMFLGAILCLLIMILPFASISTNFASATKIYDSTLDGVTLTVEAYGKEGAAISTGVESSVDIQSAGHDTNTSFPTTSYAWKDVKYFKLSLSGKESLYATGNYRFGVVFIPTEIEGATLNAANSAKQEKVFYQQTNVSKTAIPDEVYFFIDDNLDAYRTTAMTVAVGAVDDQVFEDTTEFSYATQGGWGTYIFSFYFEHGTESATTYSRLCELKTTKLETIKNNVFTIKVKEVSSTKSMSSAYLFSVSEPFLYVNRENISWKISGTATDGTKYVLRPADVTAENESTLYQNSSVNYRGATIKLDTEIQGKWIATATIEEDTVVKTATSEEVSTIKPFPTAAIIWISIGVALVAIGAVIAIITVNIKKERTW